MKNELATLDFTAGLGNLEEELLGLMDAELDDAINSADIFTLQDPVEWIERYFFIPELNGPIVLGEYQKQAIHEAMKKDDDGLMLYTMIVWSDIKKSIKSCVAAAMGLWVAFTRPWASVKVIANDLKQADSRVFFYMRRAIELNPEIAMLASVKMYNILILKQHSRIEAIPIDPKGEAGGNDSMVIYSEAWGFKGDAAERMWTESTLSSTQYGKSFRWVETYAGFSGESAILENLYLSGVKDGHPVDWSNEYDPPVGAYVNEATGQFTLWNTTPRLPWQSAQYYAQEAAVLTPMEFDRVHRNQWASSENAFVPMEWWHACQSSDIKELAHDQPIIVSVDAAVTNDLFAITAVSGRDSDDGDVDVRYTRVWRPPRGGRIDYAEPEAELRRLCKEYNVIEVCYDMYQLADMAGRFRSEMIARMYSFSQSNMRLIADKRLYDMIRDRKVHHRGEPELAEHIENSNAKSDGHNKMRIIKRSQVLKIDLAVCLSMAVHRACHWRL